jgi:hypothetical protein
MSVLKAKVPLVLASSVICLGVGAAGGAAAMAFMDYGKELARQEQSSNSGAEQDPAKKPGPAMKMGGPPMGMPMGGAPGMPPMGKGGAGGGKGMFGKGPSAKDQLAALVQKLDLVVAQPVKLNLTLSQKTQLAQKLEGLDKLKELPDAEAEKRLTEVLEVLNKDQHDVLKAVGFRFPNEKFQKPAPSQNPFAEEPVRQQLQKLQKQLDVAS